MNGKKFTLGLQCLALFFALTTLATLGSASPLCTPGTLTQYVTNEGINGPCHVGSGAVDLLFTFGSSPLDYQTDSASDPTSTGFTAGDVFLAPVTGPGNQGGFLISLNNFVWPTDSTYADLNLQFKVRVDPASQPITGSQYLLTSAHLAVNSTITDPNNDIVGVGESDQSGASAYSLQFNNPDPSNMNVLNAAFPGVTELDPNKNMFVAGCCGDLIKITSVTETFDVTSVTVPEPGPLAAVAGGLLVMLFLVRKRISARVLSVVTLAGVFSLISHASPLCTTAIPSAGISLAALETIGSCTINDALFTFSASSFQVVSKTGTPVTPSAASTTVKVVSKGNAPGLNNLGFSFTFGAITTSTSTLTVAYSYTVQAPTYKLTKFTTSASVTGTTTNTAKLTRPNTTTIGTVSNPLNGANQPGAVLNLAEPLNELITVKSTLTLPKSSHASFMSDVFTEAVPEPLTNLSVGTGLLGLVFLVRKLRHA